MIELCRYIKHASAEEYRRAGWTVVALNCHHGRWSMLATKYERRGFCTWLRAAWEIARAINYAKICQRKGGS